MELLRRKKKNCKKCGNDIGFNPSHTWCRKCKNYWYKENKYGYRNKCKDCNTPSKLKYGKCEKCLSMMGLRYCNGCDNMLIKAISFYSSDRSNKCKECRKNRIMLRSVAKPL